MGSHWVGRWGTALVMSLCLVGPVAAQQPGPALFTEPAGRAAQDLVNELGVMQARYVGLNPQVLRDAAPGVTFVVDLFSGELQAVIDSVERPGADTQAIIGRLVGLDDSSIILVTTDGVSAGTIIAGDTKYQIRYAGNGVYALREFDTGQLPEELEPLPVPPADSDPAPGDPAPIGAAHGDAPVAADSGVRFDLAVFWTAQARTAVGGTTAMRALINLGVAETNQAYANSGIIPRLRLVYMSEIAYTESGSMSTDLSRLRSTNDGHMDGVHTLRNTYGADLVKLVTNSGGGCGIAYLMGAQSAAFAVNAFSVTHQSCVSPNYTFGHELGHNMGSNHAPDDPIGTGAFSYSFGYKKFTAPRFRTVMAYADDCTSPCPRVLHFSNPARNYVISGTGYPTGTATQDNARSINNVRVTVANWRNEINLLQVAQLWPVYQPGTATAPRAGYPARLWARVTNTGPGPVGAGERVWFRTQTQTGTNSSWVGSANIAGLAPGATAWYSFDWNVPLTASGGWRYYARTWLNGNVITSNELGPQNFNITAAPAVSSQVLQLWPVSGAQGGQTATLWARVWNNGTAALPADARVWFRVTGTSYNAWVGSVPVAGLASNATAWYSFTWTIPIARSGAHSYYANVWRSGTTLISNTAGPQNFTIAAAPTTGASVVQLWPVYNGLPGGGVTLWARVRNTGTAALPATARVHYWVNSEVGSTSIAGLASGASAWYPFGYTIPSAWVGGIYNYWAQPRNGTAILSSWAGPQRFTIGFNSQFTNSNVPWLAVRGTWSNNSGAFYYTAGIASQWSSASYSTSTFTNQDVSARFWRNGDATASCIALRGTPGTMTAIGEWQHGYMFCYTRDGRYAVYKRVNHVWTAIQTYTATATVVQGSAWNLLRARAIGTSLAFWINGTLVWSGTDASLASGRTGIWQYGTGPLWIDYVTLNSGNAVPDEALDPSLEVAAAGDVVSAEQQALNDAANLAVGEPTGAAGAAGAHDRLPDREPSGR